MGNPAFSLRGNQGKGWKPAEVKYTATRNIQVCTVLTNLLKAHEPPYLKIIFITISDIKCNPVKQFILKGIILLISEKLSVLQFVVVGVYGGTEKTDIAIDSLCVTACDGKSSNMKILK